MHVLYLQPYVPTYRVPLYHTLNQLLRETGDTLTVASGRPDRSMTRRGDQATGPWHKPIRAVSLRTPFGTFKYRDTRQVLKEDPDVIVMELDPGNLNAWLTLARGPKIPLILWGHGKTFTGPERLAVTHSRTFLAKRADHTMTYTEAGRQALIGQGVPATRVSTIGNSTDTRSMSIELAQRRRSSVTRSRAFGISVDGRRVFMYAGGLDGDKRVPFLVEAARQASHLDPSFLLLVAGSGTHEELIQSLGPDTAHWIPRAGLSELADMMTVSEGVWMPGRVGLIAVDALTAGIPVHTTNFPFHAPEFEFLRIGVDAFIHPDEPKLFAAAALQQPLGQPIALEPQIAKTLSIESVASNMLAVVRRVAESAKR